jgi:hypothetical protein
MLDMRNFNFAGVSGVIDEGAIKGFEEIYDDGYNQTYVTKDIFLHEEEGLTFEYVYTVKSMDLYEATGDEEHENKSLVELSLVVHPNSITESMLKGISDSMGVDIEDMNIEDVLSYGGAHVTIDYKEVENERVPEVVEGAMTAQKAVDGLRGFYLDKPWNPIGTTGWDVIEYAIGTKEDWF